MIFVIFLGVVSGTGSFYTIPEYYGSFYKDFSPDGEMSIGFYWSSGFHIAPTMDLWISNPVEHTVTQVLSDSYEKPKATLIRIAGTKNSGNYRDGDLSTSLLNSPKSLSYYQEKVYIADTNNHCVRVIDLTVKSIKQFAGRCTEQGFKDGPSQYNRLSFPDLVGSNNGTLFINDKGNSYIRIVDINTGYMRTLWGGACRDKVEIEGNWNRPEYNVTDSKFYVNNGSIHAMVCDTSLIKNSGEPSEHIYDESDYDDPCSMHITLCANRTSPYVISKFVNG
jgi:hypothetical protein